MKTLSLFRHAKSSWSNLSLSDVERPLNKRGKKAVPLMAEYMSEQEIRPDLIFCSTAKRTRQTLNLLLDSFTHEPIIEFDEALYLAAPRDILDLVKETDQNLDHVMVIGHNPGLHTLALLLTDSGAPQEITAMSSKFPTAALAVLDFSVKSWSEITPNSGHLRLYMTPKNLVS